MRYRPLLAVLPAALLAASVATVNTAEPVNAAITAEMPAKLIAQDFPDPDLVKWGGNWYAYATNNGRHVPVASAPSVDGPWQTRGDAMPSGPSASWARPGRTWAPDVHANPDGTLTMTYTAWHRATGRQCIGVATASSPRGPFTPAGGSPLICPQELGGAIDANTFVDSDGTRYLLWKNDGNAIGRTSTLWLSRTTNNGRSLVGSPVALISSTGVIEAPDIVRRDGAYVLFYSGGDYGGCGYVTSYATATSLNGPWTRASRPLISTDSVDDTVCGPGGADALTATDGLTDGDKIVFHGWVDGSRHMFSADLGWAGNLPVVRGSRVRYEAERGNLNHCVVRFNAAGASQGAVVGYIDYADSWVDLRVLAPSAGGYNLRVTYASGMPSGASHTVMVNGVSQGDIGYLATGWDRWTEATRGVTLAAGWNVIRLGKANSYAELDFIEIQ